MHSVSAQPMPPIELEEESIDLLELAVLFLAEWKTGLLVGVLFFLLGATATYLIKPQYEAYASMLPRQSAAESNSLAAIFSGKSQGSVYIGLMSSRSVAYDVVARANLMQTHGFPSREAARGFLAESVRFIAGGDSIITIIVRNRDANQAAKIANAYLDALQAQQETMALSQAIGQRHFFEVQLNSEKQALEEAEQALKKQQEISGVVQVEAQTNIGLNAIAGIRAQITALQVQLAALLQSETEQNPQVQTLRSQIGQMQTQERALENGSTGGVGAAAPAGKMPALNLEYARKLRDVRYHEALFNAFSTQYENARLSEAAGVDAFQVVDRAIPPEVRAYPPRQNYLILSFAFAMVAGFLAITLRLFWRRLQSDPGRRAHLQAIKRNFGLVR